MAYHKSQVEWRKQNTVAVKIDYTINADPELYKMFSEAESKSGLARELIADGLKYRQEKLDSIIRSINE